MNIKNIITNYLRKIDQNTFFLIIGLGLITALINVSNIIIALVCLFIFMWKNAATTSPSGSQEQVSKANNNDDE